ncbi:hypothetical protein MPTK1_5g19180 [Marchantia polymorpha subsp. ruderalis]|uniref:cyclin-dependent kinase n=2 Tax=Marchantia polymorpha TaxID=3197 RepID=A0AAF6BJZ4_MARPO|nr:hypothetical protein MARPO_0073s0026 [Marchantia polymorpha]BBN12328.1 hypothetical protein Mp_5g19180 [Marchantia polymorpha subsp. ruderalis]|eukprot:PTQ35150.1 hypothetical protein MARPO_0073s0026 [Marchantia polymorpha]
MENYLMLEIVGYGTFGVVYRARRLDTQEPVAIKRIRFNPASGTRGLSKCVTREVTALRQLPRHQNIVKMLEFVEDRERHEVFFVFEYLDMDLRKYLDLAAFIATNRQHIKYLIHQIISGLDHCHKHNLIHRDLKPQNVLLDRRTNSLKIADFGLSRNMVSEPTEASPLTPDIATIWYRAPEVFLGSQVYTSAVDMWAAGCILAEMTNKHPLFDGRTEIDQLSKIFQIRGTPSEETWPGVSSLQEFVPLFPNWHPMDMSDVVPDLDASGKNLLDRLLILNPNNRISAEEALQHEYFHGISSCPL